MSKPVIVQSDNTLLLEVDNPEFEAARDSVSRFAELEKSPEHVHTYRITPLSLWNAASMGLTLDDILGGLEKHSRYAVPELVLNTAKEQFRRYGVLKLERSGDRLFLTSRDQLILREIAAQRSVQPFLEERIDDHSMAVKPHLRGHVKQALIKLGFPVEDLAGYEDGDRCEIVLREESSHGKNFEIRDYQQSAMNSFYRGGGLEGGSGVIVLPCGAGKTIVGIGVMSLLHTETLILVTNTVALRQWKEELLDKTHLSEELIGEYSGEKKEIRPITIATYNILTYRKKKGEDFVHFNLFMSKNWGLIIYDEVHLLPGPRVPHDLGDTVEAQARPHGHAHPRGRHGDRRLQPHRPQEIRHAVEDTGEVRLDRRGALHGNPPGASRRIEGALRRGGGPGEVPHLLGKPREARHREQDTGAPQATSNTLIIGQYIDQLKEIAARFRVPHHHGEHSRAPSARSFTRSSRRARSRRWWCRRWPTFPWTSPTPTWPSRSPGPSAPARRRPSGWDAYCAPRAARTGPISTRSSSANTVEEKFAHNRQLFLTEQGYTYVIQNEEMFDTACR